jgi:hypothetical protein
LENLNDNEDINRAGENITEDIEASTKKRVSLYELKQLIICFGEECSRFLAQRKQAKMQWLQDPSQSSVRCKASRHFKKKMKEHLKSKTEDLQNNSKIQNTKYLCKGINDFKKRYQPRTNIIKDKKGDLVTDSHLFWLGGGNISLSY